MQTVESSPIPSEKGHWYDRDGNSQYTVIGKNGKERPTTIKDAKEHGWLPSVTAILNIAVKPGLEIWKADQLLDSALTLPMIPGELADDYKKRVILDAGDKSRKAREKGTELHTAIEAYIKLPNVIVAEWKDHVYAVRDALAAQTGICLFDGKAEHSFASPLGYGGKLDWHQDRLSDPAHPQDTWQDAIVLDFKTTEHLNKKQLVWPEHVQQLAAYGFGVFGNPVTALGFTVDVDSKPFRALNVFIGVEDKQVRVHEHEWPDLVEGFAQFRCLLEFWSRIKKFGPYAKDK